MKKSTESIFNGCDLMTFIITVSFVMGTLHFLYYTFMTSWSFLTGSAVLLLFVLPPVFSVLLMAKEISYFASDCVSSFLNSCENEIYPPFFLLQGVI